MTALVKGKTLSEVQKLRQKFLNLVKRGPSSKKEREELEQLVVFEGVKEYPMRVKCATLIWQALEENKGHRRRAAQQLGISERTLYRKLKEYGLG